MKKILAVLAASGLCFSMASCSSDDDPVNIEECRPAIYTQAKSLNLVMAQQTDCLKKAETLAAYIETNEQTLKDAADDYKKYANSNSWNSVNKVICNIYSGLLLTDTYEQLKQVKSQLSVCSEKVAALSAEAQTTWNNAVNGLTSIDGWEAAMEAAIQAGANQNANAQQ